MKGDLAMNTHYLSVTFCILMALLLINNVSLAQTAPPPTMGEETKGKPAIPETGPADIVNDNTDSDNNEGENTAEKDSDNLSVFGTATITESRRESGQVYRIELEHSGGAKQVMEENDSDGSIESTRTDIDDTPNLPKWTLGSW